MKIPVSDLKPGAQVKGVAIADLGAGNQPLDMVPYKKDGHDYILIANTARGVMKLKADNLESYPAIDSPTKTDVAGVPYDTMTDLKTCNTSRNSTTRMRVIVTGKTTGQPWAPGPPAGPLNLQTIALP